MSKAKQVLLNPIFNDNPIKTNSETNENTDESLKTNEEQNITKEM